MWNRFGIDGYIKCQMAQLKNLQSLNIETCMENGEEMGNGEYVYAHRILPKKERNHHG